MQAYIIGEVRNVVSTDDGRCEGVVKGGGVGRSDNVWRSCCESRCCDVAAIYHVWMKTSLWT